MGINGCIVYASIPVRFCNQLGHDLYWYIMISLQIRTSLARGNIFTPCLYEQGSLCFSSCFHGTLWKRDLVSTALLIRRVQIFGVISMEKIPIL